MKVIISGEVVDTLGSDVWKLHQLLIYACEGRHAVFFDSPAAQARCLETFDPATRVAYARALDLTARASTSLSADVATVRVDVVTRPLWEDPVAVLPLNEAVAMLREPLGVLVENAANDWSFLLGVMRPSERKRLQDAVSNGWVEPLHGGGSDLPAQLQARLQSPHRGLRTFVMFDSDRRHPDELQPEWKPEHSESCQGFEAEMVARSELPSRYWMLSRRFIESYMPEVELRGGAARIANAGTIDAFYRMNRDERWYFNMKKGFEGDEKIENKHRCRNLYATIDASDRVALHKGFGRQLAERYALERPDEFDWDPEARLEASKVIPRLMRLL